MYARFSIQNVGTLKLIAEELTLICQHPVLADNNEEFDNLELAQMGEQSGKFGALYSLLHELKEANLHALLLTQNHKVQPSMHLPVLSRHTSGDFDADFVFTDDVHQRSLWDRECGVRFSF